MSRRFDSYLVSSARSDDLKSMVTMWGGKASLRKDACVALILQGLADPARVRAAVTRLDPYERAALALVKQAGGTIDNRLLGLGLLALGIPLPPRFAGDSSDINGLVTRALIKRGLLLTSYTRDATYYPGGHSGVIVYSDERLLAAVDKVDAKPFAIAAGPPPATSTYRPPPTVVLDIVGFLQAIDDLGGLGLTQKGELRVNDVRRVQRAVQWPEDEIVVDGLHFRNGFDGLLTALRYSGWLEERHGLLVLARPVHEIATLAYHELIAAVLDGFLRSAAWGESLAGKPSFSFYNEYYQQGRYVVAMSLQSLPLHEKGFLTIDDFDQAVFARVGGYFSLGYPSQKPSTYKKSPQEVRQILEGWRRNVRTEWLARERVWIEQALTSWLYFLGLVELGLNHHTPVSFRLTELGRAVFHPELAAQQASARAADTRQTAPATWVVQPNFELVVYLDRTTPAQLAFLERHAERTSAQQYTAHYRLTRASVYNGLESGTTLDELLDGLRSGAHADLPQNVLVELREWAALRERLTLHYRARLLEFADAAARIAALTTGLPGQPVGDRFLLLHGAAPGVPAEEHLWRLADWSIQRVNYTAPLPACLATGEDGVLTVDAGYSDLLIASQLDQWAERINPQQWRLTAERVAAAVRAGARLAELTALLTTRLHHAIPPLLGVALRNWAERPVTVAIAGVTILRCQQPETVAAIKASKLLQPYIRGELAPDTLLVDTERVAEFQAQLAWAGLRIEPRLGVGR